MATFTTAPSSSATRLAPSCLQLPVLPSPTTPSGHPPAVLVPCYSQTHSEMYLLFEFKQVLAIFMFHLSILTNFERISIFNMWKNLSCMIIFNPSPSPSFELWPDCWPWAMFGAGVQSSVEEEGWWLFCKFCEMSIKVHKTYLKHISMEQRFRILQFTFT